MSNEQGAAESPLVDLLEKLDQAMGDCDYELWQDVQTPVEVEHVVVEVLESPFGDRSNSAVGQYVKVRPVPGEDTYLGIYLGDLIPKDIPVVSYSPSEKKIIACSRTNPAIFILELKKVVWGYESWWAFISDPDQVKELGSKSTPPGV